MRIEHDVVIAGAGPTGLMLAGELALAGVDVGIVERRTSQAVDGSRAGGLHARSLEVLDLRGIGDRFVAEGQTHPAVGFAHNPLPMHDQPTRHPYVLALWQGHIERLLADWVLGEQAVPIERGVHVLDLQQHGEGVDLVLSDGRTARGRYVVGCDGGRSVVRRAAGIDFLGWAASTSWILAEVAMDGEPPLGFKHDHRGTHAMGRRAEGEPIRVVLAESTVGDGEPDLDELRAALVEIYGSDFGLRSASWISRFSDVARQAATYRQDRVLLAGDAAHVHPPQGGQGLNTGVQDAMNLGWKLARVVRGASPETLLDTYHSERHPVAARVLRNTMAQVALQIPDERHLALREHVAGLLALDEPRRRYAAMIAGLDVAYDLGGSAPLVGRRVPDLDLRVDGGLVRVSSFFHDAVGVLFVFGGASPAVAGVRVVRADPTGPWVLPVLGEVPAPEALLVRPDGHVAWVGTPDDPTLEQALVRWFGPRPER